MALTCHFRWAGIKSLTHVIQISKAKSLYDSDRCKVESYIYLYKVREIEEECKVKQSYLFKSASQGCVRLVTWGYKNKNKI